MPKSKSRRKRQPKRVLALPDLEHGRTVVTVTAKPPFTRAARQRWLFTAIDAGRTLQRHAEMPGAMGAANRR